MLSGQPLIYIQLSALFLILIFRGIACYVNLEILFAYAILKPAFSFHFPLFHLPRAFLPT